LRTFELDFYADPVCPQVTPAITCRGGAIQEINWYFYLKGSLIDGRFIPIGKGNGL
jgi:hypothetical protein